MINCEKSRPPHHRQSQRTARFAARAITQSHRNGAQQRRHGGHHDGPEADQAAFVDRLHRRLAFLALGFQREIDLHDRVLLHDADQHHQADEGIDVEIDVKHHQRQQRADTGRRQSGKNRQRMNVAFVQHAQHDVNHQDRDDQQQRQVLERTLEGLRGAFEVRVHVSRQNAARGVLHHLYRVAQRYAGPAR